MDDLLKNTLTGSLTSPTLPAMPKGLQVPDSTGNVKKDIATLGGAQKQPSLLMDFQKAMQLTSQQAYNERQTAEMEITGTQFDPTKVSGGTFAGIIGNLEQKRGADISKIYKSTMDTYQEVQSQITQRLQFLQEQERQRKEFEEQMEMKEKELKRLKKNDERAYEMEKEKFEFEKQKYASSKADEGGDISYETELLKAFNTVPYGTDGHIATDKALEVYLAGKKDAKTMEQQKIVENFRKNYIIPVINKDDPTVPSYFKEEKDW